MSPRYLSLLPLLLLSVSACRPPDAPDNLNELCGYLYDRFDEEDPAEMEAGLANLYNWLHKAGNLDSTFEGYALTNALDEQTVDALDNQDHSVSGAAGAAVGTSGKRYRQKAIVETLVMVDPAQLAPDMYLSYDREFLTDPDCFIDKECEDLRVYNRMVNKYPFIEVSMHSIGQYRWFDWEDQQVMVQRTWMDGVADINVDWLTVSDQYYLNIIYPETRGTLRLQSTWIVAELGSSDVPESLAISLVISSMQQVYTDIELYLDEH